MAKRFTDTEIWDKEWFMALSPKHKCLVRYIFDKCDVAGIWSPNWTLASAYIGESVSIDDVAYFGSQVEFLGRRIFIVDFIQFQYGTLSEKCKPHLKIISLLKKYGLYERVLKGYTYPIERVEEKDMEEEEEKEGEEDKGGPGGKVDAFQSDERLLVPQMLTRFKTAIPTYPDDRERDSKALLSIATFLCKRGNLRGAPEHNTEPILEAWEQIAAKISEDRFYCQKSLYTISNHIQEIVQKALHGDKSKPLSPVPGGKLDDDKLKAAIAKRTGGR